MRLKSVETIKDLKGKRVFLRGSLDVPLKLDGNSWRVADDGRLMSNLKTLKYLVGQGAKIVLAGYLDRPGGVPDTSKSTKVIAEYYQKHFAKVYHSNQCFGQPVEAAASLLREGEILVIENLRFLSGEEKNDSELAQSLAGLADYYVNEAFANCHRAEASLVAITNFLPSFAGFNLIEEIAVLAKVLESPKRPLLLIIGGAKVETKLPVVKNFLSLADWLMVGGLVGCQAEALENLGAKLSFYCANPDLSFNQAKEWVLKIFEAKTIVWNGPLGDVDKSHVLGTEMIAQAVVEATAKGAYSVVGGGDTEKFLRSGGFDQGISFISTGGGAMLEFLAGKQLPALVPLMVSKE